MIRAGIVVPTRGSNSRIIRLLEGLSGDPGLANASVAVVVNGDGFDDLLVANLREIGARMSKACLRDYQIIFVPTLSKSSALNAGEEALGRCEAFLYLDDDVSVLDGCVSRMIRRLEEAGDQPVVVGPRRAIDPGDGMLGRFFAACVLAAPWVREDLCQGGAIGVNSAARMKWGRFPEVACDDWFIFSQFPPSCRCFVEVVMSHSFPSTFRGLLAQQNRWRIARSELRSQGLVGPHGRSVRTCMDLVRLLLRPDQCFCLAVVRGVRLLARFLGGERMNSRGGWIGDM